MHMDFKKTQQKICAEMTAYQHLPWLQEEPTQGPSTNCFDAQIITWRDSHRSMRVPCSHLSLTYKVNASSLLLRLININ